MCTPYNWHISFSFCTFFSFWFMLQDVSILMPDNQIFCIQVIGWKVLSVITNRCMNRSCLYSIRIIAPNTRAYTAILLQQPCSHTFLQEDTYQDHLLDCSLPFSRVHSTWYAVRVSNLFYQGPCRAWEAFWLDILIRSFHAVEVCHCHSVREISKCPESCYYEFIFQVNFTRTNQKIVSWGLMEHLLEVCYAIVDCTSLVSSMVNRFSLYWLNDLWIPDSSSFKPNCSASDVVFPSAWAATSAYNEASTIHFFCWRNGI